MTRVLLDESIIPSRQADVQRQYSISDHDLSDFAGSGPSGNQGAGQQHITPSGPPSGDPPGVGHPAGVVAHPARAMLAVVAAVAVVANEKDIVV